MPRADLLIALGLAVATVLTRAPLRARLLPSWDAVQFALALREYDVVKHQPHPPGYILYVAAGRAVDALVGDPTESLTWLAIVGSAVTVFLTYRLGFRLYGRPTAVVATVGLVASPLFWFHGLVGLSYAAEAALVTAVALLVWRMRGGDERSALWSALALGLAGGVRQSILVLLLPLWLAMAWAGLRRWRPVLAGLAVLAVTTAAWLVPMVWLAGGPERYLGAARELYESTVRATTVIGPSGSWWFNVIGLAEGCILGFGLLVPALLLVLGVSLGRVHRWGARAWFLAAWITPPLAVYTWVHFGQYGYLLAVLPALYLLLAHGLVVAGNRLMAPAGRRGALATSGLVGVVLAHAAFFTVSGPLDLPIPVNEPGDVARWRASYQARLRYGLWATTLGGLREQEHVIRTYVDAVRARFDPAEAVLVAELGNSRSYPWFRHVGYYLPEFTVYHLRLGRFSPGYLSSHRTRTMAALGDPDIFLPANVRRLVWVVDYWNPAVPRPPGLEEVELPYGRWLYVLELDRRPVEHAHYRLTPLTAVARLR